MRAKKGFAIRLVEVTQDLTSDVLSSGFFVVHDTSRGGKDDETELSGWEEVGNPLFNITDSDVESWGDDSALVDTAVKLNNNLTSSVIIDVFKVSDVT